MKTTNSLPNAIKIETLNQWSDTKNAKFPRSGFTLRISSPDGEMETEFTCGDQSLVDGNPDPLTVLQCMVLDTDCGNMPFEEFCSDLGYDSDSRKALALWDQCHEQGEKFRCVAGDCMDEIRKLTADL